VINLTWKINSKKIKIDISSAFKPKKIKPKKKIYSQVYGELHLSCDSKNLYDMHGNKVYKAPLFQSTIYITNYKDLGNNHYLLELDNGRMWIEYEGDMPKIVETAIRRNIKTTEYNNTKDGILTPKEAHNLIYYYIPIGMGIVTLAAILSNANLSDNAKLFLKSLRMSNMIMLMTTYLINKFSSYDSSHAVDSELEVLLNQN